MRKLHDIQSVKFEKGQLLLLVDGKKYAFDLAKISPLLAKANAKQLNDFTLSPSGYGIHWNQLDEDLSVDGLLKQLRKYSSSGKSSLAAEPKPRYGKKGIG